MRVLLCAVVLVGSAGCGKTRDAVVPDLPAQEEPPDTDQPPTPLPDDIVKAWTDAGAQVVWMGRDTEGYLRFSLNPEVGTVPAFRFPQWELGAIGGGNASYRNAISVLPKLPAPGVKFGLSLPTVPAADTVVNELARFENLSNLNLPQADAALEKLLTRLPNLSTLNLNCSDTVLKTLRELGRLHVLPRASTHDGKRPTKPGDIGILSLNHAPITDGGLKELAALGNLTTLDLRYSQVTADGLRELAPFKRLTTLRLERDQSGRVQVTDAALKSLREVGLLHALEGATAVGGKRPTKPDEVVALDLGGVQLTDAGFRELRELKNLATLRVSLTGDTATGLRELAPLKNLTTLNTSVTVTDDVLKVLREVGLLHALGVSAGDGKRPTKPEEVVTLDLSGARLTEAGLRELAGLTSLTTLRLGSDQVTDGVLKALRELGLLHALDRANADDYKRPTKPEEVTALDLGGTKVTAAGLKELTSLKNLTTLKVSGEISAGVMNGGVPDFQTALPHCKIFGR